MTSYAGRRGYAIYRPYDPTYSLVSQSYSEISGSEKTSTNTGCFTPGIYRVNPYHVKRTGSYINKGAGSTGGKEDLPPYPKSVLGPYIADNNIYFAAGVNAAVICIGEAWKGILLAQGVSKAVPRTAADYEQLSLQKAYGKLRKADLELGEAIGEYRETIEMLRSPLSSLRKFLMGRDMYNLRLLRAIFFHDKKAVYRLRARRGLSGLDSLADTWLELRYGLRPLIMLVQEVIERVEDKRREIIDPTKIRSVRSKLTFTNSSFVDVLTSHGYTTGVRGKVFVEDTYISTASVQYRQTVEGSFLDSLGLTPRFLPETAWELTRLSFVWDWLFSIGPWLATLRINPGIEVLGNTSGFKATRVASLRNVQLYNEWIAPHFKRDIVFAEDDVTYFSEAYDRKVNLSLSYLPHFTWGRTIDLFKIIDAVALIWSPFSRKLKGLLKWRK